MLHLKRPELGKHEADSNDSLKLPRGHLKLDQPLTLVDDGEAQDISKKECGRFQVGSSHACPCVPKNTHCNLLSPESLCDLRLSEAQAYIVVSGCC